MLGVEDHHKDGETLSALSQLKATDRRQDKPPRKQPEQKRNNLYAETGQHDALVGHQPSIPCLRDITCRDVQDCMLISAFNPRARQKARKRTEIEDTATMPDQAVGKP